MAHGTGSRWIGLVLSGLLPTAVLAQGANAPVVFSVSQRLWAASWDVNLLSAQRVLLDGREAIEVDMRSTSTSHVIPITSFGVQWSKFLAFGSVAPSTRFSTSGLGGGRVSRSEWEVGIGYEFVPAWSVALIYREGKVSEVATGPTRAAIPELSGGVKLSGFAVGVSGAVPVAPNAVFGPGWYAYGTLAVGAGKEHADSDRIDSTDVRYSIGEFGMRYAFNEGRPVAFFKGMAANLGYRFQTVSWHADRLWLDPNDKKVIDSERRRISQGTQGLVAALAVAF